MEKPNLKPHITLSNEKGDSVSFFYEKEEDLKEALRKAHIPLDEFSVSPPEKIKMKSITTFEEFGFITERIKTHQTINGVYTVSLTKKLVRSPNL